MTETNSLSKLASKANGAYNSVTANSTALTSITVGNVAINATGISVSNSTSATTITLTDIRLGNTASNVVIANTVSTFGGNVAVTGEVKVSGALKDNSNRTLLIRDSANNIIWGS